MTRKPSAPTQRPETVFRLEITPKEKWRYAIEAWSEENDPSMVERLLAKPDPIPEFARAWMAGVIAGRIKRRPGLPRPGPAQRLERELHALRVWAVYEVHLEAAKARKRTRGESPSDVAIHAAAEELGIEPRAVSGIVHERKPRARKQRS